MKRFNILCSTILVLPVLLLSHPHNGSDIVLSLVNKEKYMKDSQAGLTKEEFQAFSTVLDDRFHHNPDGSKRDDNIIFKFDNPSIEYLWCYAKLYQLSGNLDYGSKFYANFLRNYKASSNFNPLLKIPLSDLFSFIKKKSLVGEFSTFEEI